jgi:hypothetical protein
LFHASPRAPPVLAPTPSKPHPPAARAHARLPLPHARHRRLTRAARACSRLAHAPASPHAAAWYSAHSSPRRAAVYARVVPHTTSSLGTRALKPSRPRGPPVPRRRLLPQLPAWSRQHRSLEPPRCSCAPPPAPAARAQRRPPVPLHIRALPAPRRRSPSALAPSCAPAPCVLPAPPAAHPSPAPPSTCRGRRSCSHRLPPARLTCLSRARAPLARPSRAAPAAAHRRRLPLRGEAPGRRQHRPLEAAPREGEAGEEPPREVPAKQEREAPDKDRGGRERERKIKEKEKRDFPRTYA